MSAIDHKKKALEAIEICAELFALDLITAEHREEWLEEHKEELIAEKGYGDGYGNPKASCRSEELFCKGARDRLRFYKEQLESKEGFNEAVETIGAIMDELMAVNDEQDS